MNKWKIITFITLAATISVFAFTFASDMSVIGLSDRYVDGEVEIDFSLLPGVRINLWKDQDFVFSTEEPSHVQHGFQTTLHWGEMTPFEQTEFLSTAEFRFYAKGEQVPLNRVTRYDIHEDYMWVIFYKVFEPGYFQKGNHNVRGEWYILENGVWVPWEESGRLVVYVPGEPTLTPGSATMTTGAGVRYRNFDNLLSEPSVLVGTNIDDPNAHNDAFYEWYQTIGLNEFIDFELTFDQSTNRLTTVVGLAIMEPGHQPTTVEYDVAEAIDWNIMEIKIYTSGGDIDLLDMFLNGFPLGILDGESTGGIVSLTISDFDFTQDIVLNGFIAVSGGFDDPDADKIEIFIGTETS